MELKAGYKHTEVGVIPEDWDVKPLSFICSMKSGESITSEGIKEHFLYPCYGGNGLRGSAESFTHDGKYVLIGRQGALCGNVIFVKGTFFASEHAIVVNSKRNICIKWLYYVLKYMNLNKYSESSAQPGLSVTKILSLTIPYLKVEAEQKAIATALSDVDALITSLDALIEKKKHIKQATMQELLTGKRRLAGFDGEWVESSLQNCSLLKKINVVPMHDGNKKFVHFSLPAFDDNKQPVIELGEDIGSNKFVVPCGAILISKLNPRIPRVWIPKIIPSNSVCSTEFMVICPHHTVNRAFLGYVCQSQYFNHKMELHAIGTTGSHQRISSHMARSIAFVVPKTIAEQEAIAAILSDMDTEISALEARRDKTTTIKSAMMQELLTGRTRLKVQE